MLLLVETEMTMSIQNSLESAGTSVPNVGSGRGPPSGAMHVNVKKQRLLLSVVEVPRELYFLASGSVAKACVCGV